MVLRSKVAMQDGCCAKVLGTGEANIIWDGATRKVTVMKGDSIVQVTIGSNVMLINGAAITMDTAQEITSDRTMLPVSFLGQVYGPVPASGCRNSDTITGRQYN